MLALIAIATAFVAWTLCGLVAQRRPDLRAALLLFGTGNTLLAIAATSAWLAPESSSCSWLATGAIIVLAASTSWATRGHLQFMRSLDDWLDATFILGATAFCGWELLLVPIDRSDRSHLALAVALVLAIGGVGLQSALTTSRSPFVVIFPVAAAFACLAVGLSRESNTLAATSRIGLSHELWFAVGTAGATVGLVIARRYWLPVGRLWGFAERFRNALVLDSAATLAIIVATMSVATRDSGRLSGFASVSLLAALFIARSVRAYLMIVGLESSVSARNAMIRLPGQAVNVRTDEDFLAVLQQLAQASASLLGASRAEIRLDAVDDAQVNCPRVTWGMTDAESDLLRRHPRVETALSIRAPNDVAPFILACTDTRLSVAAQHAWTVAGKIEALVVPLHAGNRVLGHIELWTPSEPVQFTPALQSMAADFGAEAGLMIEHSQLVLATRGHIVEAEMLLAVSEVFTRATSLTDCLPLVAERLLKRAESDRITICLIDHEANEVLIAADARDLETREVLLQGKRWPLHIWVSYEVLRRNGPVIAFSRADTDIPEQIGRLMDLHGARSYLAIAGYTEDRITSIVQIMSQSGILKDSAEIRTIWKSIATQIRLGIESVTNLEISRRRGQLEMMRRQINEALQDAGNLQDTYGTVADIFRQIQDVDGATVLSWDPRQEHYLVEAEWTEPPIPCAPVGTIHSRDQFLLLKDIDLETFPRMRWIGQPGLSDDQRTRLASYNIGAAIAMPLRVEDQMVGALMLYSLRARAFAAETVEWVQQLAGTLALVVRTIELRRRDEQLHEEQTLKLRILQAATSRADPNAALLAIAEAGLGYAGAESINIAFVDEDGKAMTIAADTTVPEWPGVEEPGTVLSIESGSLQERSFQSLQPLMFRSDQPDLGEWELLDVEEYGANAWIAAPLRVGGRAVGLLQILSRQVNAFDQRRLQLWDEVAQQVSLVISTLQVSFDNRRLSQQQQLVSLVHHAGATSTTRDEAYKQLAEVGLRLPGVESCTVFLWHEEDELLEIAAEAVVIEQLRQYCPGERIVPSRWSAEAPVRPQDPVHLNLSKPDLTITERSFLARIGMGRAAIFMLLDEGEVHGVLALKGRGADPFPPETLRLGEAVASTAAAVVRNVRSREEERRTEREQDALLQLSRAATSCESVDDLLDVVAEMTRRLSSAACAEIYIFTEDGRTRLSAISTSDDWQTTRDVGSVWPRGHWPVEDLVGTSTNPIVILDPTDPRISGAMRADLALSGIQSMALMPLGIGDDTRGYVGVFSTEPRRFTSDLVRSTATVVNQAALAIDHARTRIEEMRVADQRALLLRVSRAAGSSLDLQTVLSQIAAASLGVAQSESCVIEIYDPASDELVLRALSRVNDWVIPEDMLGKRRAFGSWATDLEIRSVGSVTVDSVDDPRVTGLMRDDMLKYETNSIVAHALLSGGNFIGMYYCFARQRNAYLERDRWVVGEIATHIISAVQNARMLENEHLIANERDRLLKISEAATRTLDLGEVLREIASATVGLAGAESCHIELVDADADEFITQAYASVPDWQPMRDVVIGMRCPIGDWPIDRESVEINAPISIDSLDDPRVTGQLREDMILYGTQSLLLIPIWADDRCVGILNIYSRKRNAFSNAQQTIAHTLATNAANAIQNARTHDRERQQRRNQEALLRLTAVATSSLDVYQAMRQVCAMLCEIADAESASVGYFHENLEEFEIVADVTTEDWIYDDTPGAVYLVSDYPAYGRVLNERKPFLIERRYDQDESNWPPDDIEAGLETYVLAPLWLKDVCIGYFGLFDRRVGHFNQDVLDLMDSAGSLLGLALSNGLTSRDQQRRAADRAAVVNVGRVAVSDADVTTKLEQISRACLDLHRVEGVSIYQWDEETDELVCMADVGRDSWPFVLEPGTRFPVAPDSPFRPFVESHDASSFSLSDPNLHPRLRADLESSRASSSAIFPLRADDQLIGIAAFYSQDLHPFDEETLRVGREVATQTALAIRASRLLETARRYASEQSALLAVNRAVMAATQTSLDDVLVTISRETMRLMGAECCEIEGLAPDLNSTTLLAQVLEAGWRGEVSGTGTHLSLSDWPVTQRILESRQPLIIDSGDPNLTDHERSMLFAFGTQSGLLAPMVLAGRAVGMISFYSRSRNAFTADHMRLATEFGSLAALAIDRARTHMALAEQATFDGLTGVLNHRALLERLDHHIALADRTEDPLGLLMIDMNDFKAVNDAYGHLAGDTVLRETATFFKQALRATDLLARYGGDEFAVILPGTDIVQALGLRNRLLELASANQIVLADGSIVIPSFAVGYAAYPSQATDRQSLIDAADRSMYEAKHGAPGPAPRRKEPVVEDSVIRLTG